MPARTGVKLEYERTLRLEAALDLRQRQPRIACMTKDTSASLWCGRGGSGDGGLLVGGGNCGSTTCTRSVWSAQTANKCKGLTGYCRKRMEDVRYVHRYRLRAGPVVTRCPHRNGRHRNGYVRGWVTGYVRCTRHHDASDRS